MARGRCKYGGVNESDGQNTDFSQRPIVIGGSGGSGTRLLVAIAQAAGYFMGEFRPFKDFQGQMWMNDGFDSEEFIDFAWRWRERLINAYRKPLTETEMEQALTELGEGVKRHRRLLPPEARWGWKLPQSLLYLPVLNRLLPETRFIHMIRDGRDMAFSGNQNDAAAFGEFIFARRGPDEMPAAYMSEETRMASLSIIVWGFANQMAADYGEAEMGNRYLRVDYGELCADPMPGLRKILNFLEISPDLTGEIANLVQPSRSIGRWNRQGKAAQEAVMRFGREYLERLGYGQ